jgi:Domain of unknown function (DUF4268)
MIMVQKLAKIPVREAFKHEAYDFSTWLEKNLDALNDELDITLSNAGREISAGDFSVDLVAEDDNGDKVIIENQLEKSNHDHLGKVITYTVAIGAKTGIWIVPEARTEHVNAINWLNETSNANFYLLKLEAFRIGDSEPAAKFTKIVGPSLTTKAVGKFKKELSEQDDIRKAFWTKLLDYAKSKTKLHASVSPSKRAWAGTGAGKSGIQFVYCIWDERSAVELYIDRGIDAKEENKSIFDMFYANKEDIEAQLGFSLEWDRLDNAKASRIRKTFYAGGINDQTLWPETMTVMVDAMIKLEEVLSPYLKIF